MRRLGQEEEFYKTGLHSFQITADF
jgi:hypothetical protein